MNCKNCNELISLSISYCPNCGAKIIRNRLTVKNLFGSFAAQFLNYDNKFLQTFTALFKKPENVIKGYINGVRKKYVNVISYFMIALTISGFQLFIINKFFPDSMDLSFLTSLPGQEGMEEIQKDNMSFIQEYQSILMMLYVPLYALMAKITFLGLKKFNFTELLVVMMYIQAQISIASSVIVIIAVAFGANFLVLSYFILFLMILYSAYCFKRLYNLTFSEIILRTLIFFIVLVVTFIFMSILMAIMMFINGDFTEMMKAKKAAQEASGMLSHFFL